MRSAKWFPALAVAALMASAAGAQQQAAPADTAAAGAVDEEWLNTIWTQVDDMVEQQQYKLQDQVTVAGVRGAEAEDQVLDKLYYKGAKRYPSQDKLKKAIETLKEAIARAPRGDDAAMQKYFVAQCYGKLGDTAQATQYYQMVTRDHADTPWAVKAKKELAALPGSSE
ncbi:MAG: hypothetical protein ABIL09_00815 [Gemmatimonadota bacterium]